MNLKPYLSITVLRLIFKTIVDECGFKEQKYYFDEYFEKKNSIYVIKKITFYQTCLTKFKVKIIFFLNACVDFFSKYLTKNYFFIF